MSSTHEFEALRAEIEAVKALVADAIEIGDVVGKFQYESRLTELEAQLVEIEESVEQRARVALLFGGGPVSGSRGIQAEFAGRILEQFQSLIARLFALEEQGSLGKRGKVPYERETRLMVTGVAHGSFGFTLAEMNDQEELCDTELKTIVSRATDLIVGTSAVEESEFDSHIVDLDSRSLVALKNIFVEMDSKDANVKIRDDKRQTYLDRQAIHRARQRIEATTIDEKESVVSGSLKGILPDHRKFELLDEQGRMIYGSATKEAVMQVDTFVAQGGKAVGATCRAKIRMRTVKPLNRAPRQLYRLMIFEVLGGEDAPLLERPEE